VPFGRRIWSVVLKILLLMFCRLQVRNGHLLPAKGAGIIYYNHIHWLDPVLICGSLRRYAVPLTKTEASRWPLVGVLLRWYHVIFISRGQVDRDALKATWQVLEDGDIVVISPEGTRSQTGSLQEAKEGLAFVARRVPVAWLMPCAVTGTPDFKFSLARMVDRPPIVLTYGEPVRVCWPEGQTSREALREITDEAMRRLAAQLPEEMRGNYAAVPDAELWVRPLSAPEC
jgi:1-acyl-sn-glycerol-3-phosphate acyltransferase